MLTQDDFNRAYLSLLSKSTLFKSKLFDGREYMCLTLNGRCVFEIIGNDFFNGKRVSYMLVDRYDINLTGENLKRYISNCVSVLFNKQNFTYWI
jgi:hypothetical protein